MDKEFDEYVEKYAACRGISKEEALTHKMVTGFADILREERKRTRVIKDDEQGKSIQLCD